MKGITGASLLHTFKEERKFCVMDLPEGGHGRLPVEAGLIHDWNEVALGSQSFEIRKSWNNHFSLHHESNSLKRDSWFSLQFDFVEISQIPSFSIGELN